MAWLCIGMLVIELTGILGAAIGLRRDNDNVFLLGLVAIHIPAYILLFYLT